MTEFWEASFQDKQTMWGFEPADSAVNTMELFYKNKIKEILLPGFGYGRNAQIFKDNGIEVTGIEISNTAINLAKKHYGDSVKVHHGSVTDMPFDQTKYDGIFCYALIHLLNTEERKKLIKDCYSHLHSGGLMVFVAISTNTPSFGTGTKISMNRYLTAHGVKLYYYDSMSVQAEFGHYGLEDAKEINEPAKNKGNKPSQVFWQIRCRKK